MRQLALFALLPLLLVGCADEPDKKTVQPDVSAGKALWTGKGLRRVFRIWRHKWMHIF
jgi:hypothetical protein